MNMIPNTSWLRIEKSGAVVLDVHVIPNASRTQADGTHDGALRVRLHAPPVDGKANTALMTWLANALQISRSHIELIRGQTAKRKQLRIAPSVCDKACWSALE